MSDMGSQFCIKVVHLQIRIIFLFTRMYHPNVKSNSHVKESLRFIYTSDVGLAFSLSDAISIEIFPFFEIAIAGHSDTI
jgi:hypothetical protein